MLRNRKERSLSFNSKYLLSMIAASLVMFSGAQAFAKTEVSTKECLLCWSSDYHDGTKTGDKDSNKFDCDDPIAKADAVAKLMQDYGISDNPCGGNYCISGACLPDGLESIDNDGCELKLNGPDSAGQCYYSVDCTYNHTPDLRASGCSCVDSKVVAN